MARLYRPHIPLSVRCVVVGRQLGSSCLVRNPKESLSAFLRRGLIELAARFGCEVKDLRLDHDPPLGARVMHHCGFSNRLSYTPDANDPDHLFYRPHGAQFDGSHDVKTRIRGEHGQYSDLALIKRARRRERKKADAKDLKKKRPKWRSAKGKHRWPKRSFGRKASDR